MTLTALIPILLTIMVFLGARHLHACRDPETPANMCGFMREDCFFEDAIINLGALTVAAGVWIAYFTWSPM